MSNTLQTHDPAIVDAIVREVLMRLQNVSPPEKKVLSGELTDSDSATHTLCLKNNKVISLESLRNRLSGISRLEVLSTAIITPAAKDELREKKIESVFHTETKKTEIVAKNKLWVARLSDTFVPTQWLNPVGKILTCCGEDYGKLGSNLVEQIGDDDKVVCFSAQPFVAVVQLNRHAGLRAAFAKTERDVKEIGITLAGNVLVLDTLQSRAEQLKFIEMFVAGKTLKGIR